MSKSTFVIFRHGCSYQLICKHVDLLNTKDIVDTKFLKGELELLVIYSCCSVYNLH